MATEIIGGVSTLFGPLIGTIAYVLLEEFLSKVTIYWHLIFGLMLVLLVLYGKGGIHGLLCRLDKSPAPKPEEQENTQTTGVQP